MVVTAAINRVASSLADDDDDGEEEDEDEDEDKPILTPHLQGEPGTFAFAILLVCASSLACGLQIVVIGGFSLASSFCGCI